MNQTTSKQLEEACLSRFITMKGDGSNPRNWSAHGYVWVFDEDGALFYQKEMPESREQIDAVTWRIKARGYMCIRLIPTDLTPRNFELMCRMDLTNTNPA